MSQQSLQMLCRRRHPIDNIIAEDESWVYCWDPQSKSATKEWLVPGEPCPEKVRIKHTVQKLMLVAFVDKDSLVYREFVPNGLGIGAQLYCQIVQRFLQALRRHQPHLATRAGMRTWALVHDGAPTHRAAPVVNFLQNSGVQLLPHHGYSPDLNPLDYWFFHKVKTKVKGIRHHNVDQLQEAVDASIGSITRAEFTATMDRFTERLRRCIAAEGRYFERD